MVLTMMFSDWKEKFGPIARTGQLTVTVETSEPISRITAYI